MGRDTRAPGAMHTTATRNDLLEMPGADSDWYGGSLGFALGALFEAAPLCVLQQGSARVLVVCEWLTDVARILTNLTRKLTKLFLKDGRPNCTTTTNLRRHWGARSRRLSPTCGEKRPQAHRG